MIIEPTCTTGHSMIERRDGAPSAIASQHPRRVLIVANGDLAWGYYEKFLEDSGGAGMEIWAAHEPAEKIPVLMWECPPCKELRVEIPAGPKPRRKKETSS